MPYLQLLQPVLTFGLLVLTRLGFCATSSWELPLLDPGVGAEAAGDARDSEDMAPVLVPVPVSIPPLLFDQVVVVRGRVMVEIMASGVRSMEEGGTSS